MEPVPDAAVLQDEVGDDACAVAESDQSEQGFVSVSLCGDVRGDAEVAEPPVGDVSHQSVSGEYERLVGGGKLHVCPWWVGLDEDEGGVGDGAGEEGCRNAGRQGCDGEVGLTVVEEREGGCRVTGPHRDVH